MPTLTNVMDPPNTWIDMLNAMQYRARTRDELAGWFV